ncbi:MAG: right-handed parallel beta-helix repeat-containing protein [Candidatus Bathyarchaeia archaeon]|nr:right-handed parallel beta-helix repeat-containing protein [Candidatus Bathyarchaeia archaeon]
MPKTKALNKTITTVLILLITLSTLSVINIPAVKADTGSGIQEMINIASAGATVYVPAGIYNETIAVNKSLSLIANGTVIINATAQTAKGSGAAGYGAVWINASDVHFEGFRVMNAGWNVTGAPDLDSNGIGDYRGIAIGTVDKSDISNVTITNCVVNGSGAAGIQSEYAEVGIVGNRVFDNQWDGFVSYVLRGSSNITNNEFTGNGPSGKTGWNDAGIEVGCTNGTTLIENNTISNNVGGSSKGVGIYLRDNANYTTIKGNDIKDNSHYGVLVKKVDNNVIYYNNIVGNGEYGVNASLAAAVIKATLNWWGDATGPSGVAFGSGDAVSANVAYDPWLDAPYPEGEPRTFARTISPDVVSAEQILWFDITVTNDVSEASIYKVNITYPITDGWTFVDMSAPPMWVIDDHDSVKGIVIFRATGGYEIPLTGSAVFKFKMTTGKTTSTTIYEWGIECTNTAEKKALMPVEVTVDVEKPTIAVDAPTVPHYSVGAGGYLWLNITVHDDVNALPTVVVNDTRFELYASPTVTGTYDFAFRYINTETIPDGPLNVHFNVTDYVGNVATEYPKPASTTVDNTAPFIWIEVEPATPVGSTFYIGIGTTIIDINVTVANYGLEDIGPLTGIYINDTLQPWTFSPTAKEYKGYPVWEHIETGFATPLEDKLWILYVNATDTASPSHHTSEMEVKISRDLEPPYEIGFTPPAEAICGGVIIRGLYAKDLVGVKDYMLYVNGTLKWTIGEDEVTSTEFTGVTWQYGAFQRIVVLYGYAGEFVNITVIAEDFGLNPSDEIVLFTGVVPEGEWCPVELYEGWNLISLPLIPASAARTDILSLILKQGIAGVTVVYEYDQNLDSWISNPTTMTDGKGYWVHMKAYDVMIVSGSKMPPPGGIPPTYTLTKGWVLAGFKSTSDMTVAEYLASVRNASYFKILFVWDAKKQAWDIRNRDDPTHKFTPGQGFWIYMYEEEVLIPPLP